LFLAKVVTFGKHGTSQPLTIKALFLYSLVDWVCRLHTRS
jgi:hypothetical protein